MSGRLRTIGGLTVLWLLLWRDVSVGNVLTGLLVATAVSTVPARASGRHRIRPVALAKFVGFFAWKLVEANVVLAREVVTPTNSIHTGIIAVTVPTESEFVLTVVANAVSLTPGTLTLEVRNDPDPVLYVHILHLRDISEARDEVLALAELAAAAFPVRPPANVIGGDPT